ncbi:MAG: hypothetical protein CVV64_12790 [Candidatus Wallbacteria bacterium HGW-Wallbacteria-1]|uniref:DUF1574 domain-containing protein n=1 Tax=Candidatus Wallbacteria bacterium HGW-Wallbacteria-1 TaxID=2013854 RepID=A0A2N1PMW6_9BACT|nr:MAG: hypothetical protein CVV64_12790 [Candidatus Wallbacteria bacterium HGW-Wallbacteria-1]
METDLSTSSFKNKSKIRINDSEKGGFPKLPLNLLTVVLFFCIFNIVMLRSNTFWKYCHQSSRLDIDERLFFESRIRLEMKHSQTGRILLLGSSQVREGFDELEMNRLLEGTGLQIVNLGYGGNAPADELLMDLEIAMKLKPAAIVYMPFVASFYSKYLFPPIRSNFSPAILPYIIDHFGISSLFKNATTIIDGLSRYWFVMIRHRESVRELLIKDISNSLSENRSDRKRTFYGHKMKSAYYKAEIDKSNGKRYGFSEYSNYNKEVFQNIAISLKKKAIPFIVLRGPSHPLLKKCYPPEVDDDFGSFLEKQSRLADIHYLNDRDMPEFTADNFCDFTHMNSSGRDRFTKFMAEYLLKMIQK